MEKMQTVQVFLDRAEFWEVQGTYWAALQQAVEGIALLGDGTESVVEILDSYLYGGFGPGEDFFSVSVRRQWEVACAAIAHLESLIAAEPAVTCPVDTLKAVARIVDGSALIAD